MNFFSQLQTNERENSATLTTSDGELRLFAYDCPDVSTIHVSFSMYFIFYLQALLDTNKTNNSKRIQ